MIVALFWQNAITMATNKPPCSAMGAIALLKCTYGTGCFLMAQTGLELTRSRHKLLSTVARTKGDTVNYGMEGAMFTTDPAFNG